ncbi:ABC transporter substrate-binding protein [Geomesophilobacter sediminis]|uniref:ABC transporter substrate-binding protein n=1 Tax=Geomesophilobacter sediminis TaxID=2798584 RepID=A0A8J7JLX4_9BACT|nr:ABC transporter substrate-binding protein [Geomesophilobacter sediminis]MBJ6725475.1 ABC transporter substrate-binding protein [Geomesophilobacter sediminis]
MSGNGPSTCCSRRNFLTGLGTLLLLPLFAGCSRRSPLRVAAHLWPGYEPLFLAQREGWLSRADVVFLETASATMSLEELKEGRADAACLTLDEMLRGRGYGIPLTAVTVFDVSAGADAVLAGPGIGELKDLAGRRVAVEEGALGAYVLAMLLQQSGLRREQLRVISCPGDTHRDAWQRHEFDAVITYEPTATLLENAGMHRIFDSRRLPGAIVDVLAVRSNLLHSQAAAIKHLLVGYFRAQSHLKHNPQDAAYRMAGHLKLPAEELLASFKGLELPGLQANRLYLSGKEPLLAASARSMMKVMLAAGLLKVVDPLQQLASSAFLPSEEVWP